MLGLRVLAVTTPGVGVAEETKRPCTVEGATPVTEIPADLAEPGDALVTVGMLNLRAGPSTDCPIVGSLGFGMQVRIDDELLEHGEHLWRRVETPVGNGYTVASGFQGLPEVAPTAVPVVMYHHIDESGGRYSVSPGAFAAQLAWLRDNGYISITPMDLYNARYHDMPLPARPVMLTIDDGYPSTRTFRQLLDAYGFRGVYFLPNYTSLSPEEIRALADSGEVCGHTVSHPFLEHLDYGGQWAEIVGNKVWLEGIVGRPVTCFAYPFGSYNGITRQVLADAGHLIAFNAWGGMATVTPDADPYHVLRMEVYGSYDLQAFINLVTVGG
jgi:peptidoglycan/xylan/chitin deacetylase (PgdA/CDA1 family)